MLEGSSVLQWEGVSECHDVLIPRAGVLACWRLPLFIWNPAARPKGLGWVRKWIFKKSGLLIDFI